MKKLISVFALLLVFATLLTSCAVNIPKADMKKYVSLADGYHASVKVEVQRTNLYKETVRGSIYEALRGTAGNPKTGDEPFAKYDSVELHTIIFNQKGEIVSSSVSVNTDSSTGKVTGFADPETLSLGFGANRDILADIESQLLDPENPVYVKQHLFTTTIGSEKEKADKVDLNSILLLTYYVTGKDSSTTIAQKTSPVILISSLYAQNADNSNFKEGFEPDPYLAAIYAALEKMCSHEKIDETTGEGTGEYPNVPKLNPSTAITITVKPTSMKPDGEDNSTFDASAVTIYMDISFDTSNDTKDADGNVIKTYEEGKIYFTPRGMIYGEGGGKTYIKANDIVIYEKDETEEDHDTLEGELDVIILPVKVTPYPNMLEYDVLDTEDKVNALTAKLKELLNKDGVTPVSDDVNELKAQYEKLVYEKLDKDAGFSAKADETAKDDIWSKIVAEAIANIPEKNVKNQVKNSEELIRYAYHNGEYPTLGYYHSWSVYQASFSSNGFDLKASSVTTVPASKTERYKNWKDYAIAQYEVATYDEVYATLYSEAEASLKEIMVAYYMAEKLGITIDDARYAELVKEDYEAWLKNVKEYYKNAPYIPTFTLADFEEENGGKDAVICSYLLDLVKDELFKIVTANGGITYKEVYNDGTEVTK